MQHSGITIEDIQRMLYEKAEQRFGKTRAQELRPDIEQVADELLRIYHYPTSFEDEP